MKFNTKDQHMHLSSTTAPLNFKFLSYELLQGKKDKLHRNIPRFHCGILNTVQYKQISFLLELP